MNAEGSSTTITFCYSTSSGLANCAGGTVTSVPGTNSPTTSASQATSATLSGLNPGTTYYFQIKVSNAGGTAYSSVGSFTTTSAKATATERDHGGTAERGDPQRHGERRERLDHGHLLLQHLERGWPTAPGPSPP